MHKYSTFSLLFSWGTFRFLFLFWLSQMQLLWTQRGKCPCVLVVWLIEYIFDICPSVTEWPWERFMTKFLSCICTQCMHIMHLWYRSYFHMWVQHLYHLILPSDYSSTIISALLNVKMNTTSYQNYFIIQMIYITNPKFVHNVVIICKCIKLWIFEIESHVNVFAQ